MIYDHDEAQKTCFLCANAFVDDEDHLHCCSESGNGKVVNDEDTCDDWN